MSLSRKLQISFYHYFQQRIIIVYYHSLPTTVCKICRIHRWTKLSFSNDISGRVRPEQTHHYAGWDSNNGWGRPCSPDFEEGLTQGRPESSTGPGTRITVPAIKALRLIHGESEEQKKPQIYTQTTWNPHTGLTITNPQVLLLLFFYKTRPA